MASLFLQAAAGLVLAALPGAWAGTSKACTNPLTSCGTTASTDTCCFNTPGGQMVQTQFWDTSPSTGPSNSWTIHGLWPDHCDGTYDSNCDSTRAYTGIGTILANAGQSDLVTYMNQYWVDINGNDETFWEHEWAKHGTCISTLAPACYTSYTSKQEAVDFFVKAVSLFKTLPTYTWLANAGITPSSTKTYTSAAIIAALKAGFGQAPTIQCSSGALDEVWYSYNVQGSVQLGTFIPVAPSGQTGTCASTGIKYLPKSGSAVTTTTPVSSTSTSTSTASSTTPTGTTGLFSGTGYLEASGGGCLISAGTWYTSGTCATYTASASGSGFTLKSTKGACAIVGSTFSCASSNTATVFTAIGGLLAYNGATNFYATATPSGSTQATVYTTSQAVSVTFSWTAT